ncbi:MAG: twin-arginine translocase subunit TatB [Granulosicoccus sp.]|nr:twin-arginine translocase subunit TatB [Granulosicoccus sp.]
MFDVGFTEILLIGIVALIVIGPERLPAVARTAGQWVAKLQRFVRGVKSDLASELESGDLKKLIGDQREQINELKQMVSSAKKDFETTTREAVKGAKKNLEAMESTVKELDASETSSSPEAMESTVKELDATEKPSSPESIASSSHEAQTSMSAVQDRSEGTDARDNTDASVASDNPDGMNRTGTESGN